MPLQAAGERERLPLLWEQLVLRSAGGQPHSVFHEVDSHRLTHRWPDRGADDGPVRGGVLADEMGMGKTVELLACLLAHPFAGPRLPDVLVGHAPPAFGLEPQSERCVCCITVPHCPPVSPVCLFSCRV